MKITGSKREPLHGATVEMNPRQPSPAHISFVKDSDAQGRVQTAGWGSGANPLASGEQDTLNDYHTKIIHVGQNVVFQRKMEMLLPKEGERDAGQAKTTDVHCSRFCLACL